MLTTLPLTCAEQAWEVVQWEEWRWQMEDFPKALTTGGQLERHQLQTIEAMWRLFAILTPLALRLLVIRQAAQHAEEIPATPVVSAEVLQVVTHLDHHREVLTASDRWRAIARLGGSLDRKHDGPPGWQTVGKGWMRVSDV